MELDLRHSEITGSKCRMCTEWGDPQKVTHYEWKEQAAAKMQQFSACIQTTGLLQVIIWCCNLACWLLQVKMWLHKAAANWQLLEKNVEN